jgi:hypothetical protein
LYAWWANSQRLSSDRRDDEVMVTTDRYALDAQCRCTGRLRYLEILYAMHVVALIYFHPLRRQNRHLTVLDLLRLPMCAEAHNTLTRNVCRSFERAKIPFEAAGFPYRLAQKHQDGKTPEDLFSLKRKQLKAVTDAARKTLARLVGCVANQTKLEQFFETVSSLVLASDQSESNKALFYEFAATMAVAIKQLKSASFKAADRVLEDVTLTRSGESFKLHFTDGSYRIQMLSAPRQALDAEVWQLVTTFKWRYALREIDRIGRAVAPLHAARALAPAAQSIPAVQINAPPKTDPDSLVRPLSMASLGDPSWVPSSAGRPPPDAQQQDAAPGPNGEAKRANAVSAAAVAPPPPRPSATVTKPDAHGGGSEMTRVSTFARGSVDFDPEELLR